MFVGFEFNVLGRISTLTICYCISGLAFRRQTQKCSNFKVRHHWSHSTNDGRNRRVEVLLQGKNA